MFEADQLPDISDIFEARYIMCILMVYLYIPHIGRCSKHPLAPLPTASLHFPHEDDRCIQIRAPVPQAFTTAFESARDGWLRHRQVCGRAGTNGETLCVELKWEKIHLLYFCYNNIYIYTIICIYIYHTSTVVTVKL